MNILQSLKISLKKLKFNKGKSLFVIIPIALMYTIIVIGSSEATSLMTVAHNSIFSPIQSQNEVIELNKNTSQNFRNIIEGNTSTGYTTADNTIISAIPNIEKTNQVQVLPISPITSTDIFKDKTININSISGLDEEFAKTYTDKAFTYDPTSTEAIPIILNANDFAEIYEDWQGKNEISIDFSANADPASAANLSSQSPVKTRAIPYTNEDLIGKTITINFGGLDKIYDIKEESTTTGFKYTKKTDAELSSETETRKNDLSKYWDYTKISTPLSYKFIVVGISKGTDKTKTFVPLTFSKKLLADYFTNEVSARNGTTMASTELNTKYTGIVYDGVTLQNDSTNATFARLRNQVNAQVSTQFNQINSQISSQNSAISNQNNRIRNFNAETNRINAERGQGRIGGFAARPGLSTLSYINTLNTSSVKITFPGSETTYTVPGLIYTKDRTSNEVTGENKDLASKEIPIESTTILIKVNSVANREGVITALNSKGYTLQDFSQYKQYNQLETYLYLVINVASGIFMAVTALFILINMAKFVSESRKEIGIFRAIGATRGDIRLIFILQSLSYIVISTLLGLILGVGITLGISSLMASSAQSLINTAVGSSIVLSGSIAQSSFMSFNYMTLGIYTALLLLVTLIVSLIPSNQAAKVSPVEAIRN